MKSAVRSKAADFDVLKSAASTLFEYLRMDEAVPDLYEQISSTESGSHRFYIEPYNTGFPIQMFSRPKFVPLPPAILANYRGIECASFMGLLPELNRAWITIDNKLFLWDYLHPNDFLVFDELTEVIIAVSLSAPKASVFNASVKYILVVATPVEVVLLALVWDEQLSQLRLQTTNYTVPSDNITMFKVIGSQCGRIFMGGNDGNVYELEYDNSEALWPVMGPARKCRKLNHSAWHWKLIHIVPPFLREITGWNDSLVDLAVDDCRHLLYSITAKGDLCVFSLGLQNKALVSVRNFFNVFEEAQRCISSRPRESSPKADYFRSASMKIVGVQVIPPTESRQLHLLVILSTGIRLYLSVRASDGQHYFRDNSSSPPADIKVVYVRSPPPAEATAACMSQVGTRENTFLPTYLPSQPMNVHAAYYNHGLLFSAVGADNASDKVVVMAEDLIIRSSSMAGAQLVSVPSFREALSVVAHEGADCKVYDIRESCASVHHADALTLRTGFVASKSPSGPNETKAPGSSIAESVDSVYPGYGAALTLPATRAGPPIDNPAAAPVVPLNEFSAQMAPGTRSTRRQILCLLNNGLLILHKNRPIDILYRILETTCVGDEYVDKARFFFTCFGLLQSSAMCVAIACNLPADLTVEAGGVNNPLQLGGSEFSLVQRRALTVMQRLGDGTSFKMSSMTPLLQDSRFALTGTTGFVMSTCHDSIQLVLGRILRTLWYKPVVSRGKLSQLFSSRLVLASIRVPLLSLKALLLNYFAAVVKLDLAELKKDDDSGVTSLLLRQIQLQSKIQVDQEKQLSREAKRKEDCSIHALYRLVSRSVQALSLLDILIAAVTEMKVKVSWSLLESLTMQSLVTSPDAHDKVQRLVDGTLEAISASKMANSIGDRLTELLSIHCFLFFSAGDRFRYEASKTISQIVELSGGAATVGSRQDEDVDALVSKGVSLMMKACRYWRGLDDVTSSISTGTINPSILKRSCIELAHLGVVGRDAIVDLCLATAENFTDSKAVRSTGSSLYLTSTEDSDWEHELYHGGGVSTTEGRVAARKACYQCLIEEIKAVSVSHMKTIGGGIATQSVTSSVIPPEQQQQVTLRMIERSVHACSDSDYLTTLYDSLYEWDRSFLLRLNIRSLESYLVAKDPMVLYEYFGVHRRSMEASNLAAKLALTDADMDIVERIRFFTLAVTSSMDATGDEALTNRLVELQDRKIVAEFQRDVHAALSAELEAINTNGVVYDVAERRGIEALSAFVQSLKFRLKNISELYLQATEPYKLWDLSLQLLYAAKSDDAALIVRLWKSLVYRKVPENSSNFEAGLFLQAKRSAANIDVDARRQRRDVLFEHSASWLSELLETVLGLGRALRGGESEAAFPLQVVAEELEEITLQLRLLEIPVEADLVAQHFLGMGMYFERLIQSYMAVLRKWETKRPEAQIHLAGAIVAVLVRWVDSSSYNASDRKLLYLAVRGQKVGAWLTHMRQLFNSIPSPTALSTTFRTQRENCLRSINRVDQVSNALTLA